MENLQEIHRNPNTIGGIFFPSIHHRIQPAPAMLRRWGGRVSTQRPNLALLTVLTEFSGRVFHGFLAN